MPDLPRFRETPIQRQFLKQENSFFKLFPELEGQQRDIICPFKIYLGKVNNTELGDVPNNTDPANFYQFSQIFSGSDAILAVWEDSSKAYLANDGTGIDDNGVPIPKDTYLTKEYRVGKKWNLFREGGETSNTTFTPASRDTSATQQQVDGEISFLWEGGAPTEADKYKFYIIPTSGTNKLYYLKSAVVFVKPNKIKEIIYSQVVFSPLNNMLATTGAKIENFIAFSAPGEGYAFPKLKYEIVDGKEIQDIELDQQRLFNRGITNLQIELLGTGLLSSIIAYGRRALSTDIKTINPPKRLLAYKLDIPIPTTTNRGTGGENNFFWALGEPNIDAVYDDWKKGVLTTYDLTKKRTYDGALITDYSKTKSTNKIANGSYRDIFEKDLMIDLSGFSTNDRTFDCKANELVKDDLTLPTSLSVADLFNFNGIVLDDMLKMTIGLSETTTWGLKHIPLVGGILSFFTGGIGNMWKNSNKTIPSKLIPFFIPTAIYEFSASAIDTNVKGKLALDTFRNDTEDTIGGMLGTNNGIVSFNLALTDKVLIGGKKEASTDTLFLGQKKEDGGFLYDGSVKATTPLLSVNEGFILDLIVFKGVFKGDVKITAWNDDTPAFQMLLQTRSKWADNIREITNIIKLSNWEEVDGKSLDFPKTIIPPSPDDAFDISIKVDKKFSTSSNELRFNLDDYLGKEFDMSKYDYLTMDYDILIDGNWIKNNSPNEKIEIDPNDLSDFSLKKIKKYNENFTSQVVPIDIRCRASNGSCISLQHPNFRYVENADIEIDFQFIDKRTFFVPIKINRNPSCIPTCPPSQPIYCGSGLIPGFCHPLETFVFVKNINFYKKDDV